jgi:hypothetical protein
MAWIHALIAGLIAAAPGPAVVVTDHDASLPNGCRPAQVARVLLARDARLTEVIVGYANGLGQLEFRLGGNLVGKGAIDCSQVLACVRHWR